MDDVDNSSLRSVISGSLAFQAEFGERALEVFLYDLWRTIHDFESHERMEYLRFDGNTIFDPHPPGSRGTPLRSTPSFPDAVSSLRERTPA